MTGRFYLIALLFLAFDFGIIFFYPWTVVFGSIPYRAFLFAEAGVFLFVILVGYIFAWRANQGKQ